MAGANTGIEGDWVRTDSSGSGSFGGLSDKFQKAELTPAGASMVANSKRPPTGPAYTENGVHKPGDPYIVVAQPCGAGGPFAGGGLGVNPDSNAIHIVAQKDEVIIAPERNGIRHIYMDGRHQPDLTKMDADKFGTRSGSLRGQSVSCRNGRVGAGRGSRRRIPDAGDASYRAV